MKRHLLLSWSVAVTILLRAASLGAQDAPPTPREESPNQSEYEKDRDAHRPHAELGARRESVDAEREELTRNLDRARREIPQLLDNGHEQEAAALKERASRWERRLNQLNRPTKEMRRPSAPEAGDRRGPRPDNRDAQAPRERPDPARMAHVKQAIEHLHAAGLHALADRLTREWHQRQQRPQNRFPSHSARGDGFQARPDRGPNQGPGGRDPMRQDLQRQLDDLRRQFEEMRRRMDAPPNRGYRRTEMSDVW